MLSNDQKYDFIAWLRTRRELLLASGPDMDDAFASLGWDEKTLRNWERSSRALVSTPHASPNVFGQRMRIAWAASAVQRRDSDLHHVRVVLTHTNLSDLGWRPYAWWTLDETGRVNVARIRSRNKKEKHRPIYNLPSLDVKIEGLTPVDSLGARRARLGVNLASSYMLLMATVEAAAGFTHLGRTTYLPLDTVLEYVRDQCSVVPGFGNLLAGATGRGLDSGRTLTAVASSEALVYDNATNIAALAALGSVVMLGGSKMMGYWQGVEAASQRLGSRWQRVRPFLVPELECSFVEARSPTVQSRLRELGVEYSQGMAVTELGDFALRQDPFGKAYLAGLQSFVHQQ